MATPASLPDVSVIVLDKFISNLPDPVKSVAQNVLNGDNLTGTIETANYLEIFYPEYGDFLRAVSGTTLSEEPDHPEFWAAKQELKELMPHPDNGRPLHIY